MSITAYTVNAKSFESDTDYVFAHLTYAHHKKGNWDTNSEKIDVMWSHECVYGVSPRNKVGDFTEIYLSGMQYGVFTHRSIAEKLKLEFTGLKIKELNWFENPYEKKLKSGKVRKNPPKWLPEKAQDLVYLYSDVTVDVDSDYKINTDFFVVNRKGQKRDHKWFMCSENAVKRLKKLGYKNLKIEKSTIIDNHTANEINEAEKKAYAETPVTVTIGKGYETDDEQCFLKYKTNLFSDAFADRHYWLNGIHYDDKTWYFNNQIYLIEIVSNYAGFKRNVSFKNPNLKVFEDETLAYFKEKYDWIETKNKVHIYIPKLCLIFSSFGKKKDKRGKRIIMFDEWQREYVEQKVLKLI